MSPGPALDVPEAVLEYLRGHDTLTLATASPTGIPRATTLLYVNDGPTLYFWTRASTLTARQVGQNPVVAFTIDDYTQDLGQTRGVQGLGECSVVLSGEQIARVADLFGQKFPSLAPGSTLSISFFRITPSEIDFIDNTAGQTAPAGGTFGADFHRERSYSVIAALPLRPAERINVALAPLEVRAGETIVRQGSPADKFFILLEGEAEVVRDGARIETLSAGQLFGEVTIMRDQPRSAGVVASSDARLLGLEREVFKDLISQAMEITPDFDEIIRRRLDGEAGA